MRLLSRLSGSLLARSAFWTLVGQSGEFLLRAAYFVVLARCLGAAGYGTFLGVVALAMVLGPLSSVGAGYVLLRDVARKPDVFAVRWGNALAVTVTLGFALLGLLVAVGRLVVPASMGLVLCVGISDILLARLVDISGQCYQAHERVPRMVQLQLALAGTRFAAALTLWRGVPEPNPGTWAAFYAASSAVVAAVALWRVRRDLGAPQLDLERLRSQLREGAPFALSGSAHMVYSDVDKSLLSRLAGPASAGVYGAAARVIDVAFMPVRALLFASYARYFKEGASGIVGTLNLTRRLMPASLLYALVLGAALYWGAPFLPWLLGSDYGASVPALRWLAALPLLRVFTYFAGDALTGAGFQSTRLVVQLVVAAASVGANLWLVPTYAWRAAAWVSLGSSAALAVGMWAAVWWIARGAPTNRSAGLAQAREAASR